MADQQPAEQSAAAPAAAENLHKDPVTGEMISKSERTNMVPIESTPR